MQPVEYPLKAPASLGSPPYGYAVCAALALLGLRRARDALKRAAAGAREKASGGGGGDGGGDGGGARAPVYSRVARDAEDPLEEPPGAAGGGWPERPESKADPGDG